MNNITGYELKHIRHLLGYTQSQMDDALQLGKNSVRNNELKKDKPVSDNVHFATITRYTDKLIEVRKINEKLNAAKNE